MFWIWSYPLLPRAGYSEYLPNKSRRKPKEGVDCSIDFIPELVYEEITRTEDDLSKWLKDSKIPILKISEAVTVSLQKIYAYNPVHKNLVDNTKSRSLADPWVIAHAMNENATVVTKEEKVTALSSTRIKIPNVCENMGLRWMNDFDFVHELGIKFTCSIK